ncbi:hypothetical protein [Aeromonas salmonicida]|uniref:hypothetical protein n=1 Tax=Aeromonas salmonicida TaxID=645 RepID=UPI003D227545
MPIPGAPWWLPARLELLGGQVIAAGTLCALVAGGDRDLLQGTGMTAETGQFSPEI